MNKFQQLFTNTIIFAIGNILTKLILFLLMPLYTTALTTEQYGIADLLTNSIELILPIMTLCISDAVFRFSIDENSNKITLLSNGIYVLFKGSIIFIIGLSIVSLFFPYEYWMYFGILYLSNSIRQLFAQFTRGIGLVRVFATSGIISAITLVIVNIILLLGFNGGIRGYLVAIIFSNIVPIVYLAIKGKLWMYIDKKAINKVELYEMLKYSAPNAPNMLSWWVNNVSSRYIINIFCGAQIAGLYAAASRIPALINVLSSIFQQAWQYSSAREYEDSNRDKFYSDVFQGYSAFILIAATTVLMILPVVVKFILLGDFYNAWIYIPLLLISATLGCYSTFFGTFYLVVKRNTVSMVSTIVGAIINLIICFLLVPPIGVYGALVGSVISYAVITVIRIVTTRKYVSIKINYINLVTSITMLLIQAITMTVNYEQTKIIQFFMFIGVLGMNGKVLITLVKELLHTKK